MLTATPTKKRINAYRLAPLCAAIFVVYSVRIRRRLLSCLLARSF
ncbi:hypothetical protein CAMRE0001_1660 [Campylobacter rectus RM3267]|uniref:Uncharacterized protein n=1 Tax=Campylobacter rectus RM3267 TaxID=553218 RepID=B9CZ79_CAMRE|nr:hypothetical protein CAMRE0001_1660 [Campylobacter rectus RM3267]